MKSRSLTVIGLFFAGVMWCLQGCPSESTPIRKEGQTGRLFETERKKMLAFIERGRTENSKKYREQYKSLLNTYKKKVYDKPDSTLDRYLYGLLLVDKKQKWKQFQACIQANPKHFWCLIGRGRVYASWKIKDRAEKDFLAAKAIKPERMEPLLGLAELAMLRRRDQRAIALYKQILAKDSTNVEALYGLAVLHERQGKKEAAISYYEKVLAQKPKHFDSLQAVGHLYYKRKDMAKAASAYQRAIQIHPRHFRLLVRLATISEKHLGKPWKALALYERASKLPQSHFFTYYRLGVLRGKKGDIAGGIAALKQAMRLQNEHPDMLYALGSLYLKKGDTKNAVTTLWKALRLSNGKISVRIALAKALEKAGDFAGVLRQYEQIVKLDPKRTDIKELMAKMLKTIGLSNDSFRGGSARAVFNKGRRRVYSCYRTRLKTHPKLKGQVALKLIVNPTGTVDRVTILIDKTTLDDNLVHACIKWTYRRAIFPRVQRKRQYQIKSILQFSKP